MKKLKHYVWYSPDDCETTICLEHPTSEGMCLCGGRIDETPDGQPEETIKKIDCSLCLKVINIIKKLTMDNSEMKLPENKKCKDCIHFTRCFHLFGCKSENVYCDFYPIRFEELKDV